jgi:hypothetical protein
MIGLHRSRLIQALGLPFEERLNATIDGLRSLRSFADPHDLKLLDVLVADDAQRTVDAMIDLIAGQDENEAGFKPWLMWLDGAKLLSRLERASSPELVMDTVTRRVDQKEWPRLVDHIDLSPQEPDALLMALLDRSEDPNLRGRTLFRFMYPETAYTGPESAYLRGRQRVAEQWIEAAPSRGGYRSWLDELVRELDQRIESVEVEEAERGH